MRRSRYRVVRRPGAACVLMVPLGLVLWAIIISVGFRMWGAL